MRKGRKAERIRQSRRGLYDGRGHGGIFCTESTKDMAGADYSDTNIRQEGVGEADTVKTDGKNLYILNDQTVEIVDVSQAEMKDLASIEIDENCFIREVFVSDGRLVILYNRIKM